MQLQLSLPSTTAAYGSWITRDNICEYQKIAADKWQVSWMRAIPHSELQAVANDVAQAVFTTRSEAQRAVRIIYHEYGMPTPSDKLYYSRADDGYIIQPFYIPVLQYMKMRKGDKRVWKHWQISHFSGLKDDGALPSLLSAQGLELIEENTALKRMERIIMKRYTTPQRLLADMQLWLDTYTQTI